MKRRIFIDTDMGIDDIGAIAMLAASGSFDIVGISVVNGVSRVGPGSRNAARLLSAIGLGSVPVFTGMTGAGQGSGLSFPPRDRRRAERMVPLGRLCTGDAATRPATFAACLRFMASVPEPMTLVCLGPLSNVARMVADPTARRIVESMVIMGGAIGVRGNVAPTYEAEYNIALDPRSASSVFGSGLPILMVPVDACTSVPASVAVAVGIRRRLCERFMNDVAVMSPATRCGAIIRATITGNDGDVSYLYDQLVAAILIDPTVASARRTGSVIVGTEGIARGVTTLRSMKDIRHTVTAILRASTPKAYAVVRSLIGTYKPM